MAPDVTYPGENRRYPTHNNNNNANLKECNVHVSKTDWTIDDKMKIILYKNAGVEWRSTLEAPGLS